MWKEIMPTLDTKTCQAHLKEEKNMKIINKKLWKTQANCRKFENWGLYSKNEKYKTGGLLSFKFGKYKQFWWSI